MSNQIVPAEGNIFLAPAARLDVVLQAYQDKKEFINKVLDEGKDYGKTPGTGDKPALLKPGAEKLANFFSIMPTFEDASIIEDWTGAEHGGEPFFYYRQCAMGWRIINGERVLIGSADGSCNSWETKYRYRQQQRICPTCGKSTIIKGKIEYGGGWVCFAKKGGCGAKFVDGDQSIEGQQVGQIKNPDPAELVNTVLKMAQKRALVAMVLIATGASDYFTQDIDDFTEGTFSESVPAQSAPPPPTKKANGVDAPLVRPLSPEVLADFIVKKSKRYTGNTCSPAQRGLVAMMLNTIFGDDQDKRHTVQAYLLGAPSLTDAADEMVLACLDWLKPVQDSGGAYMPDPMAEREAQAVYTDSLKGEGQQPLL